MYVFRSMGETVKAQLNNNAQREGPDDATGSNVGATRQLMGAQASTQSSETERSDVEGDLASKRLVVKTTVKTSSMFQTVQGSMSIPANMAGKGQTQDSGFTANTCAQEVQEEQQEDKTGASLNDTQTSDDGRTEGQGETSTARVRKRRKMGGSMVGCKDAHVDLARRKSESCSSVKVIVL
jgi:hypothetical protein